MQFLTNLIGGSENTYLTAALALGIVLVLIVLGLWGLKLLSRASKAATAGRHKRLSVVDTLALDAKRQLVIVRRDDVEHLLLVGGAQDVLIESNIPAAERTVRPAGAAHAGMTRSERMRAARNPPPPPPPQPTPSPPPIHEAEARQLAQIRGYARQDEHHGGATSLRHTGLLRPVSTLDPGIVRLAPENSAGAAADSARSGARGLGGGNIGGGITDNDQGHWRS